MTVLVTGASGFVGRKVVAGLVARGHDVVAASRTPPAAGPRVLPVSLDVRDLQQFRRLPDDIRAVVHAAVARTNDSTAGPNTRSLLETNVLGTLNVLEFAERSVRARMIYCSSASVYSLPQPLPIQETGPTYPVAGLDAEYGATKLSGELLCSQASARGRIGVACLRFARIYGPSEPTSSLISDWIGHAQSGQEIVVYGGGERSMDLMYIDEAAHAICGAVERDAAVGVINVGSGVETSWTELATTIADTFTVNRRSQVRLVSEGSRTRCCLDTERARRLLGFEARVSLRDGLAMWKRCLYQLTVEET